jgi:hypothetical protein
MQNNRKFRSGLTLIEVMMGVTASVIVLLTVAILLVSGHHDFNKAFKYANGDIQMNAIETMINFGITGRKSNKTDYKLYQNDGGNFETVLPSLPSNPEEVVFGNAVEFRYWNSDLNSSFMDTDVTGNAYALYYVEDNELKVDRGVYPPGGVDASGNKRVPASTATLAKNVQSVIFSHMTTNAEGDGNGCVKMDLTLYDAVEDRGVNVKTATLMRNVWP